MTHCRLPSRHARACCSPQARPEVRAGAACVSRARGQPRATTKQVAGARSSSRSASFATPVQMPSRARVGAGQLGYAARRRVRSRGHKEAQRGAQSVRRGARALPPVVRRSSSARSSPNQERWNEEGIVDREAWRKAGDGGFLCPWLEPEHGGRRRRLPALGGRDRGAGERATSRASPCRCTPTSSCRTSTASAPTRRSSAGCRAAPRASWSPRIAMTEPGTGSDLAASRPRRGATATTTCSTAPRPSSPTGSCATCASSRPRPTPTPPTRTAAISLFVVEADAPGFTQGKKLEKMGMASQDTAELALRGLPRARRQPPRRRGRRAS